MSISLDGLHAFIDGETPNPAELVQAARLDLQDYTQVVEGRLREFSETTRKLQEDTAKKTTDVVTRLQAAQGRLLELRKKIQEVKKTDQTLRTQVAAMQEKIQGGN